MIRIFTFLCFVFVFCFSALAQEPPHPCGTPDYISPWLKKYVKNPEAYQRNVDDTLYIPLTIHTVTNDNTNGFYDQDQLLNALCVLNQDFAESNIQFYIKGEILYYSNTDYNIHNTVEQGYFMMFDNNVDQTINNYIVTDPAGNCGYNLPYAGIALKKSCISGNNHTWAHEIGHNLSVQHPFLGWEGGVSHDGSVPHSYNDPAPNTVTYDYTSFQDTFYTDTLIIDTAFVERVDGSNCDIASDLFCDTPPDYLSFGWPCDSDGFSTQVQTDPNGQTFKSDGSLFMSYAFDECQSRFTPEQIAAMRANLMDEKPELLDSSYAPLPVVNQSVQGIAPINGDTVGGVALITLEWEPVPNATHYYVEASFFSGFPVVSHSEITTETTSQMFDLNDDKTYYWRVWAYNNNSFCHADPQVFTFYAPSFATANTNLPNIESLQISPNPVSAANPNLQIEFNAGESLPLTISLVDAVGREIKATKSHTLVGENNLNLSLDGLRPGMYVVQLLTEKGKVSRKVIVQ